MPKPLALDRRRAQPDGISGTKKATVVSINRVTVGVGVTVEAIDLETRIGSEICATADSLLTPDAAAGVRRLLVERGVLVFRQLNLTDEQQVRFARMLGSLREEGQAGIFKITLDRKLNAGADYLKGSFLWHLDGTHHEVPIFASLLSGRKLSATGGQTEFANSHAAYDELPQETKNRIDGVRVVHSVEVSMRRAGVEACAANLAYWRTMPARTHKLVWAHKSGRRSLVIGCHASHVEDMELGAGRKLLQDLLDWTTQPRFVYRHEWAVEDLLIWDNTGVLHRAEPYAPDSGRVMHRTTLLGEEAFA